MKYGTISFSIDNNDPLIIENIIQIKNIILHI